MKKSEINPTFIIFILIIIVVFYFAAKTSEEQQCESQGGYWFEAIGPAFCNMPTQDFGKICNDDSDCQGGCIVSGNVGDTSVIGECSQYRVVLGCNPVIEEGTITTILCQD